MTDKKVKLVENWPILYHEILHVNNPEHHLGICTLWTERDVVDKLLTGVEYNVIGNLYSAQGINAMMRNIFANPNVRTIAIWGSEMSLSGHSLLMLKKNGVDQNRKIVGGRGEIETEIPDEAIEEFRKYVEIVDLRGKTAKEFRQEIEKLAKKQVRPFLPKPKLFPKSEPKLQVLPSEQTGFYVRGKTVAQTWLKLLNEIYKYGRPKYSRYSKDNEIKEVLNMVAVVEEEDPDNIYFPKYLPFERAELEAYYAEIMTDREIPGVAYNYGRRMRRHFGVDQITKMKELLKKRPTSKKMIAITTDPKLDWSRANKGDTPCLVMILGSVQDNKFFLTAHFRSHDMVHGWPRNTFALRKLQKDIADYGGLELGPLTMISHSAHMYSDDFMLVGDLLDRWFLKELGYTPAVHFDFDKRGNIVVEVVDEKDYSRNWEKMWEQTGGVPMAVRHELKMRPKDAKFLLKASLYEPDGGPLLKEFVGRTPHETMWLINDWNYLRDPAHAMYIGIELEKAFMMAIEGKRYDQDPA